MNNQDRSLDDIQSDIRRTRGRLDDTLSAVEQRLEPGQLLDQGVHYLRNHGVTEYFGSLGESAKRQPLPLALVGLSLAWLMVSDRRARGHSGHSDYSGATASRPSGSAHPDTERSQTSSFKSAIHDATDRLAEKRDAAVDTVADMREKVSGAVNNTLDKFSHSAQKVKNGYEHMLEEQPLALGAIGLGLGALLAASAPRTRREDQLMGSASDRLMSEAKDFGRETVAQAKEAVTSSLDESDLAEKKETNSKTDAAGTTPRSGSVSPTGEVSSQATGATSATSATRPASTIPNAASSATSAEPNEYNRN